MLWIILGITLLLFIIVVSMYNSLIKLNQKVKNAYSQIDIQLHRRFDLIPNLVDTVKGYMSHEDVILINLTKLRASWANATSVNEKFKLDNELSNSLKTFMVISENYPDLKTNQNFLDLQEELQNTENKISFSTQFYNDTATMYNTKLKIFPSNLIAGLFGFKIEELFKVKNENIKENVKIYFNK